MHNIKRNYTRYTFVLVSLCVCVCVCAPSPSLLAEPELADKRHNKGQRRHKTKGPKGKRLTRQAAVPARLAHAISLAHSLAIAVSLTVTVPRPEPAAGFLYHFS